MSSKITNKRISFASTKNQLKYPDFLEVQLKSFREFFQLNSTPEDRKKEGLYQVFSENFPITDTRNNFVLEFLDYYDSYKQNVLQINQLRFNKMNALEQLNLSIGKIIF